jgi:histidine triad (HIT) family protein
MADSSNTECIFCKIAKGEIPCVKIWEDKDYLAFLDIAPYMEGMTLLIPKKHFDSKIFEMPEKEYVQFLLTAKKVANILKTKLNTERILMVVEGLDVPHVHIKLYPYKKDSEGLGLKASHRKPNEELQKVANKILD